MSFGYAQVSSSGSGLVGFANFCKVRVRVYWVSFQNFGFSGLSGPDPTLIYRYVQEICFFLTSIYNDQNLTGKKESRTKNDCNRRTSSQDFFHFLKDVPCIACENSKYMRISYEKKTLFILFGLDTPYTFTKYLKAKNS